MGRTVEDVIAEPTPGLLMGLRYRKDGTATVARRAPWHPLHRQSTTARFGVLGIVLGTALPVRDRGTFPLKKIISDFGTIVVSCMDQVARNDKSKSVRLRSNHVEDKFATKA